MNSTNLSGLSARYSSWVTNKKAINDDVAGARSLSKETVEGFLDECAVLVADIRRFADDIDAEYNLSKRKVDLHY